MRRLLTALGLLCLLLSLTSAWAGYRRYDEERIKRVLKRLPDDAQLLINLDPVDLPATSDLIRLGHRVTPAIINGLVNSMQQEVRQVCASVLVATRDPKASQALMDALEDPNNQVRRLAVEALGQVENLEAVPRFLELLQRERLSYSMRTKVIEALGRLGDPQAIPPLMTYFLETWDRSAQEALWNLRRLLSPDQLEQLILPPLMATKPQASDSVLRFAVEKARLLKVKEAIFPLMLLFDRRERLQNRIVFALGHIADPRAIPFLKQRLKKSGDPRLLNNLVFALQRLGEEIKPFLREALKDRRAYIRFNAAFVVGDLAEKALLPELLIALKDSNDLVRSEVAVALGKLKDPGALKALEAASREHNPIVRRDALLSLGRLDYPQYRARILKELLPSEISSVRQGAVNLLVNQKDPSVISEILADLNPENYSDRRMGLRLLGAFWEVKHPDAVAFLLRVAAQGDQEAVRLLARYKPESARFILRQWLKQPGELSAQLHRAMGRYGDRESLDLAHARLNSKGSLSLYAAFHLASLGEAAGLETLLSSVEKGPLAQKRVAARLLTELKLKAQPSLNKRLHALMKHEDIYVRIYAARGLLGSGDEEVPALLWAELEKRVPFIRDEVLDVVERAPKRSRARFMNRWISQADPFLKRALREIQE